MKKINNDSLIKNRHFLKDNLRMKVNFIHTDQNKGIPPPPIQKPVKQNQTVIKLSSIKDISIIHKIDLITAIKQRKSIRKYLNTPLSADELSFLLWATQGIRGLEHMERPYRVVPSAGCRHSFETYIAAINIENLNEGFYRYLPIEHALVFEKQMEHISDAMIHACLGQSFVGDAAAVFIWSCIPYRMEWRYDQAAHRVIAFDVGHVCQNLYLAVQSISSGTCAIGAYHQQLIDNLLNLDGDDEFAIYMAAVGKIKNEK